MRTQAIKASNFKATTESEEELEDEETILLIRKFKCFFNKNHMQEVEKEAIKKL